MSAVPVKIGFVLLSNSQNPIPSTRIAALNMFPFLRASNFEPHIIFEPLQATEVPDLTDLADRLLAENFRIVFFQKVHGTSVEKLAWQLKAAGVKTVYGVCDLVNVSVAEATDATIVVTEYLKSLYPLALHSRIHVVHDGVEHPDLRKTSWRDHRGWRGRRLHAVLVTSAQLDHLPILDFPPEWLEVTIVGHYPPVGRIMERLQQARWTLARNPGAREHLAYLKFLANRRIRCVAWHPNGVYDAMREADIGIIPIERRPEHDSGMMPPSWKVKSENRLTLKMAMGLPVIATPIPAYESVIDQGKNGFLARSRRDWMEFLDALRDPVFRRTVGDQARNSILERYSMQEQARRLLQVLNGLLLAEGNRSGISISQ
jgi:glycosyltransferase involved in cell wall biosynthesis